MSKEESIGVYDFKDEKICQEYFTLSSKYKELSDEYMINNEVTIRFFANLQLILFQHMFQGGEKLAIKDLVDHAFFAAEILHNAAEKERESGN